ncbi:MAG: hypothetical protein N3A65_04940 [candidate division WOR-3 bacterium]|nr:hypothetical protein [candidate division WOR-3 bacterium]
MDLIRRIYIKFQKPKFLKPFRPIGITKKENFVIIPSEKIKDFFKLLPFLAGIRKLGNVILLVPEAFSYYIKCLRTNYFQVIYYQKVPQILTREYNLIKNELNKISHSWFINLNPDADISFSTLTKSERRVAFYNKKLFPYYNILVKGGLESLINFFQIQLVDPLSLFRLNKSELKMILKELPQKKPRLFFNQIEENLKALDETSWNGSVVYCKKIKDEIENDLKKLYLCDAYFGPDDEMCELARIFKKEIITTL